MPVLVNRSMVSVTTSALPCLIVLNRSPLGARHSRSSHGLYFGPKCFSTS